MCGIVGIASKNGTKYREWLSHARDSISYRGPDDFGEWWSNNDQVGFGHQRLSIIDISDAGHQPMSDESGFLHIVFNGEIYNYEELRKELIQLGEVFKSDCDTEILLYAYKVWGTDFLDHLNGMFAFVLHDARNNTLFMARDRIGEKPLFYKLSNGEIQFASELTPLIDNNSGPKLIDMDALDLYLTFGYVSGDFCMVQGINKLPAAHALLFDINTGKSKSWKYWNLPQLIKSNNIKIPEEEFLLDELEMLLEDSVYRQMQADVPIGILLSGGVDSSLVTAMAARKTNHVKTFNIRFPGHHKFDETQHARLIAEHFKTEHIELEAQDLKADLLVDLAKKLDSPIIDSSLIPTFLVSQLVKKHCKVVLGGDGGDELFGGYSHYSRLLWMQKYFGKVPSFFRNKISNYANKTMPFGMRGRNWLRACSEDLNHDLPIVSTFFDPLIRVNLLKNKKCSLIAEDYFKENIPKSEDLLQRATRMDLSNFLSEDILVKVDRASMLNSLEVRAPFLDYRLVEFAFRKVPSHLKVSSSTRKHLLKSLTNRVLPSTFDKKRKQGFVIPLDKWLENGSWRDLFYDVLRDSNSIYDRNTIDQLLIGQEKGRNNSERLFGLVFFEIWRKYHALSL
jgi:asparagine synthase (glutamine-hydrolysing)